MKIKKEILTEYPVLEHIRNRWSPRAFDEKIPEEEILRRMFEAARRAPSAFNVQPWSFILGIKGSETYNNILNSLIDFNKEWAKSSPLLMVVLGRKINDDGNHNSTAEYDTGQAVMSLTIEGMSHGVFCHQMTGVDKESIKDSLSVKDYNEVISVVAIGYPGDIDRIPESMHEMEKEVKSRKDFNNFVFTKKDGNPYGLFK